MNGDNTHMGKGKKIRLKAQSSCWTQPKIRFETLVRVTAAIVGISILQVAQSRKFFPWSFLVLKKY